MGHKASIPGLVLLRQPSRARGEGVPIDDVLGRGELKALKHFWRKALRPGLFPLAPRPLPVPFHARVTPDTLERGLLLGRVFSNTRPAKISASQGSQRTITDNTSPTACGGRLQLLHDMLGVRALNSSRAGSRRQGGVTRDACTSLQ